MAKWGYFQWGRCQLPQIRSLNFYNLKKIIIQQNLKFQKFEVLAFSGGIGHQHGHRSTPPPSALQSSVLAKLRAPSITPITSHATAQPLVGGLWKAVGAWGLRKWDAAFLHFPISFYPWVGFFGLLFLGDFPETSFFCHLGLKPAFV